jgi:hypothetical protein
VFFTLLLHPACGQTPPKEPQPQGLQTVFDLLTKEEAAKITIESDFTTIAANKKTNQYFPGVLTTGDGKTFKIELRPRGRFRRRISQVPPLKIKFSKKSLRAMGLDTLNNIKLVLPSIDNEMGSELVVKEYLIYRMYEALTPVSVRARLIKLTMNDSHIEQTRKNIYAILVEDEDETALRMKGKAMGEFGLPADSFQMNPLAMLSMFEYMIGNTDWDIAMSRNVRMVRPTESGKILVMPYDFDFSGLVSAPYASPSTESGLKSIRDRFLMANGVKPEALKRAARQIKVSQDKLYSICKSRHISRDSYNQMTSYLDVFFQGVSEKDEVPPLLKMPIAD